MRVLLALGGNAMTAPDGSATPDDQIAAVAVAMERGRRPGRGRPRASSSPTATARRSATCWSRTSSPRPSCRRCRWTGAAPRPRRTLGFILMNALDAALGRARRRPRRCAALVTRTLVDRDDPGFTQPTKPIGRFLPRERGRSCSSSTARPGRTAARRAGAAWSPRPSRSRSSTRRPVHALVDAGFVVVAQRRRRHPGRARRATARCAASRRSSTRTSAPPCSARTVERRRARHRHRRRPRRRSATAPPRPSRSAGSTVARDARRTPPTGHFASGLDGPEGRGGLPVRRAPGGPRGHHRPRPASSTRVDRSTTGTVVDTARPTTTTEEGDTPCPTPSRSARSRSTPSSDASRAGRAHRRRRDGRRPGHRRHRQDRGQRRGQRLHPDHRRPRVPRGARREGRRPPTQVKQVPIVWSGGTDGVISPHATIFATVPAESAEQTDEPRLTVGFAMSEQLLPEDIGRTADDQKVADAVKVAMERAGITDPADVHYVQTKTPLLTIHTIRDAKRRGKTVWTEHTHESMDLSNGCTALGIAVALGEIEMPTDADVMHDRVAVLVGRVLLLGRRARPGPGRRGRQRPRRRRPLPDRPLGDDGRARPGRHLGRDPATPASTCPSARTAPTSTAGWSTCSSSARPRQDGAGARPPQRDARRLRRALAPPDQVLRRRRHRRGHRRPGGVRVGVGGPPGPRRRRPGRRDRRPRLGEPTGYRPPAAG